MGEVKKYIIYAEDDIDDREMLEEMMARINSDIVVRSVSDGKELLHFLTSLSPTDYLPCFVLLDINMPVMDGFSTLKALKAHPIFSEITVVMYSTANHSREINKSMENGAVKFITKPFSIAEIEAITRQFVQFCETQPVNRKGV